MVSRKQCLPFKDRILGWGVGWGGSTVMDRDNTKYQSGVTTDLTEVGRGGQCVC